MSQPDKLLSQILSGRADANIDFKDMIRLLRSLGFDERIRMSKYEVIIYWSEDDDAYVAEVPELPGCMADGSTYQEAPANAETIIQAWIETAKELGRPIPEPKGKLMYA